MQPTAEELHCVNEPQSFQGNTPSTWTYEATNASGDVVDTITEEDFIDGIACIGSTCTPSCVDVSPD